MRVTMLLAVFMAVLGLAGAALGTDGQVPIKGGGPFAPAADATFVPCTGAPGVYVPSKLVGQSRFSHLGLVSSTIYVTSCAIGPGGLTGTGPADHVAANGDTLHVSNYVVVADPVTGAGQFTSVTFDGGTGRFAHATGSAVGTAQFDFATGAGDYALAGTISSVGSTS